MIDFGVLCKQNEELLTECLSYLGYSNLFLFLFLHPRQSLEMTPLEFHGCSWYSWGYIVVNIMASH